MIAARLQRIARQDPHAIALIAGNEPVSYAALLQTAAAVEGLLERAGVGPGAVVMVSLPSGWQAVATFAACASMGAVFLPANPAWRERELAWLVGRVSPSAVVVGGSDAERWIAAGIGRDRQVLVDSWTLQDGAGWHGEAAREWPADQLVAYMITSGSTGRPKIVPRTHGGTLGCAKATAEASGIGPEHTLLASVPFYHGSGFSNNLLLPLASGARLVLLEHFEPAAAAAAIERYTIEYLWTSPMVYGLLVDSNVPAASLRSLRVCLCGGAPLAGAVMEAWKQRCPAPIRQSYGSSETATVAICDPETSAPEYVGLPIPETEVCILSGDTLLPQGQRGEIAVRGPGVLKQYLDEPPETAARFWNGYVRTGDLGWMDESGRIFLTGRIRPWINTGGVKVDPIEVRRALSVMPGVRECTVEAEPGPRGGDVVAAVIAPEPGVEITRAQVIRHCRLHLAEYKIPRVVRFVKALAIDTTGKTHRPWV